VYHIFSCFRTSNSKIFAAKKLYDSFASASLLNSNQSVFPAWEELDTLIQKHWIAYANLYLGTQKHKFKNGGTE
jgi:hypothetical protein